MVVAALTGCSDAPPQAPAPAPPTGGVLIASQRSAPASYNRLVSPRTADEMLRLLTHDTLVRVNRTTGALEPRLAVTWQATPDGRRWTVRLRSGVRFSDGAPFTSADVAFTLRAIHDPRVESALAEGLRIGGQPITVETIDAENLVLVYPAPHGRGIELFGAVPMLPRHKLAAALDAGTLQDAWSLKTPLSELAGLGPFVLTEHVAGDHLRFARNPHFWNTAADGRRLPLLDGIQMPIIAEQDAEMLRLEAGDIDLTNDAVRAEDIAALEALAAKGAITMTDAGVSTDPDGLWLNLTPGTATAKARPWLHRVEFRRAMSLAVNRQDLANTVYLGQAVPIAGPITPGHRDWHLPDLAAPHDLPRARALLASIGLTDRNGDGMLDDAAGRPVRLTVLTHKGSSVRERSASFIRAQLAQAGIAVEIEGLDPGAIFDRYQRRAFDAIYFGFGSDTIDPAGSTTFWLSSGPFHVWNPGQARPATPWEAEMDRMMQQQMTSLDPAERRRLFSDVQRTFDAHLPTLYFVARKTVIATHSRVQGIAASVLPPPVLWNAEQLWLATPAAGARRR